MKWYEHIFGDEKAAARKAEKQQARTERKIQKQRSKIDKKAKKIEKWNQKFDKNLAKATNWETVFFSRTRHKMAERRCVKTMEKMLRTGYRIGNAKKTKEYEYGRSVLDHVLKSRGGYPFISYSYNKNTMDRIMKKAAYR